jgi:alpha-mannosidase
VVRTFRASRIVQRYVLTAGSSHVDVETEIDWHEERAFLRALFPTGIRARHATFGIQFGHIERPTHRNTSWDEARFEVPGHRWTDLSQPGLGFALLDDGKFGRSVEAGTIGLSLLRGTCWPGPGLDRGRHRFTYALMPHAGDFRAAGVPAAADEVAEPWVVLPLAPDSGGGAGTWQPFEITASDPLGVEIACYKPAADGSSDRILRLVERRGGVQEVTLRWPDAPREVVAVDLLERPLPDQPLDPQGDRIRIVLQPFRIVSLRLSTG